MTFHAYSRARRMGLALHDVRNGRRIIDIQLDRGFESGSAFREAFTKLFGFRPAKRRRVSVSLLASLRLRLAPWWLSRTIAGCTFLYFVDRRGLERRILTLRASLSCAVVPGNNVHLDPIPMQLHQYFIGTRMAFDVPLVLTGYLWEQRVWGRLTHDPTWQNRLLFIPGQEVRTATRLPRRRPRKWHELSGHCRSCHRVIRADGSLCGYGGGLWRKQWLLDHEHRSRLPLRNGRTRSMTRRTNSWLSPPTDREPPDQQFGAECGYRHLPPGGSAAGWVGQDRVVAEAAAA